jgi:hypothetical protein
MDSMHDMHGMAGMDSMHDTHGMNEKHDMHGMDTTMKKAMAEVRAVLTPEQQKQFDAMMAAHEQKHHAMPDPTP